MLITFPRHELQRVVWRGFWIRVAQSAHPGQNDSRLGYTVTITVATLWNSFDTQHKQHKTKINIKRVHSNYL